MEMNELDMNEMETKRDKSISHEVHSCDINYIALRLVVILTEWERYTKCSRSSSSLLRLLQFACN